MATDSDLQSLKREVEYDDHIIPLNELCQRLETNINYGLTLEEAKKRLALYGPNVLKGERPTPWWKILFLNFFGVFASLLWIAATLCVVCYFLEKEYNPSSEKEILWLGVLILIIILITGIFGFVQEKKSSDIMEAFCRLVKPTARVVRGGHIISVPMQNIVLGDVVHVTMGDCIPGDMRIIEVDNCKVDNSSLTGESDPLSLSIKTTNPSPIRSANMAFFSSNVLEGSAKGIIIACGANSYIGHIAQLASSLHKEDSSVDKDIQLFVYRVAAAALLSSAIFLAAAIGKGYGWMHSVILVLGLLVAFVPEGLPLSVSVSLALTASKMKDKNCLVKSLKSVVSLGQTAVICTDKTGTLTLNRMSVITLWYGGKLVSVSSGAPKNDVDFSRWIRVAALCNRAEFLPDQDHLAVANRETTGDASETAILKYVEQHIGRVSYIRETHPKVYEEPFNSTKKYQLSLHEIPDSKEAAYLLALKGAPERILEKCNRMCINGDLVLMNKEMDKEVHAACESMAAQGQRVLAFAEMLLDPKAYPKGFNFKQSKGVPLKNLVLLGFVGLQDPPRANVPYAVERCKDAHIKVIMVTGDHPTTAKAIARKVGIFSADGESTGDVTRRTHIPVEEIDPEQTPRLLMTGTQLHDYDSEALAQIIDRFPEIVFARTSPTQKLLIVETIQSLGYVVAVTGDGVNDSPALKRAEIGIAMGITGTDVAKDVADIVLMDDNFASIVTAIEQGRVVFDNLQKSIAYVLTSNVPEIFPFVLQMILDIPAPLTVALVLVIDAVTDVWPSISLAYERPEKNVMLKKPRTKEDSIINCRLLSVVYLQVGVIQAAAALCTYFVVMMDHGFWPRSLFGTRHQWENRTAIIENSNQKLYSYEDRKVLGELAQTATFSAIVCTQVADLLICRSRRDSLMSRGCGGWPIISAIVLQVVLAGMVIYIPGMEDFLPVQSVPFFHWLPGVVFSLLLLIVDEARRWHLRGHPSSYIHKNTYY